MGQTNFDELSFMERLNYLWNYGDFIVYRWENNNLIGLYYLNNFYVEIRYKGNSKHVDVIESIKEDNILPLYLSDIDLSPLFSFL